MFRLQMRHYLSWIEGLTTNQYVRGSNPLCRTMKRAGQRLSSLAFFVAGTKLAHINQARRIEKDGQDLPDSEDAEQTA